ncbi:MAG TPA: hypothetical protein VFM02_00165 [Candidatus Paceibacterota bacterium]|nr:hypothetical protein [Candidatus Paceibacterota bacterium]
MTMQITDYFFLSAVLALGLWCFRVWLEKKQRVVRAKAYVWTATVSQGREGEAGKRTR